MEQQIRNFKIILIILTVALTLPYIPCDCRTFTSNLKTSYNGNNSTRISRQNKGIETNSIQRLVGKTTDGNQSFAKFTNGLSKSTKLKRVFLSNRDITCNDGSQAGFYLRKSPGSKRWVVFFEGGWYCFDHKSCKMRWTKMRHLMTSTTWPETRDIGGILSPSPTENPYWYNANHVFVPYCSSDSWSGRRSKPESRDSFRFMGSLIVRQVMADLIPLGLGNPQGTDLLMAGSSAGGLGVMLNLDKTRAFLQDERGLNVHVRGVSDSGWFLDREPFTPGVAAAEAVRQGWKLWDGVLPDDCVAEQKEPWRCYFGHRLYNTLKSPLFIFQWLFDEAQMRADNVGAPVTPQQWDYIHEMGGALRESLENVTAVFAPSCIGHSVLTKRDWQNIKIDDVSFTDSLRCWENSLLKDRKIILKLADNKRPNKHNKNHKGKNHQSDQPQLTHEEREQRRKERRRHKLTPEEREQRRLERRERRRQEKFLQKMETKNQTPRAQRSPQENEMNNKNSLPKIIENEPVAKQQKKNRRQQANQRRRLERMEARNATRIPKHHRRNQQNQQQQQKGQNKRRHGEHNRQKLLKTQNQFMEIKEPKKCALRLLERCSWPQCNHSCPSLTNPLTGEEMKFLELLTSFGLDMDAVAQALGVDMQTLNNMDHKELIKLFTESTS